MERSDRIRRYQEQSRIVDEVAGRGNKDESLHLQSLREEAAAAGDKDYEAFFEAESICYFSGDYTKAAQRLGEGIDHAEQSGGDVDAFLLCNLGVYHGLKGDEDAAIEWYDKALAENSKDWKAMRQKSVSLSNKGDQDAAIVWSDNALAENPKDWHAMREKGVALSKKGDENAAIVWYDHALAENPKDWNAMRQKGVSLSKKGDEDAAIIWFNHALTENPKDGDTMRQRGVSLSKKGEEDAAIEWYDHALVENPKDWDAMRQKGVALSKKGYFDVAIEWYGKALDENPKDGYAMRNKGVALFNMGDRDGAIEWLGKAFQQDSSRWEQDFRAICKLTGKDFNEIHRQWVGDEPTTSPQPQDPFGELRMMINTIRDVRLKEQAARYLKMKKEAEAQRIEFLEPQSCLTKDRSLLMVLRKWNSYTPALPASTDDERSRGGGYFIWHNGHGTVIDPGFNFIENFHQAGGRMCDIDNIILTHDHPDHTAEFETLRTLLFEYNDNLKKLNDKRKTQALPKLPPKRVRFFLNNGAFRKFAGMLDLREPEFTERVITLNRDTEFDLLGGGRLRVLPAYHDELLSRDQAVGLLLTLDTTDDPRRILLTSDTGLFPLKPEAQKPTADASQPDSEIGKQYLRSVKPDEVDVMLVHIGSINPDEFDPQKEKITEACYPNHLGIIGTARVIAMCRPKLAVVSEFGEEMRDFRFDLIKDLRDTVLQKYFEDKEGQSPQVVPGDLAFVYSIMDRTVLDCATRDWSPAGKIDFWQQNKADGPGIYYAETVPDTDEKMGNCVKLFCTHRETHDGLYFVPD